MEKKKKLTKKWKFCIGTTSRIPHEQTKLREQTIGNNRHYLMLDIDGKLSFRHWKRILDADPLAVLERTPKGFHVYTSIRLSGRQFVKMAKKFGADPVWIEIGRQREYWFLADKCRRTPLQWKVERMILHAR